MSRPHLQQVDYIRAIASLSVAVFHLGGKAVPVLNYGWLGVEMFFLLSGFIICYAIPQNYSYRVAGTFIWKRILRIEPPYILSILLAICVHFIFDAHYLPNWTNILYHLAYINSFIGQPYINPVYWTLAVEFQFYLFVALFFPLIIKKWSAPCLVALSVGSCFIALPANNLLVYFPLFAMGMLYYLYQSRVVSLVAAIVYGILLICCGLFKLGFAETAAASFALVLLLVPLKNNGVINFFSRISFSLYLTHDLVGSSLVVYLGTKLPKTIAFKGLEFLTGLAVSILFAYLFYLLVEAPAIKLSKKVRYDQ